MKNTADGDVAITANVTDTLGVIGSSAVLDTTAIQGQATYTLTYAVAAGVAEFQRTGFVGVGPREWVGQGVRVMRNPAFGVVRFEIVQGAESGPLDIYDVLGRRVASMPVAYPVAGPQIVTWRAGAEASAGVYVA